MYKSVIITKNSIAKKTEIWKKYFLNKYTCAKIILKEEGMSNEGNIWQGKRSST